MNPDTNRFEPLLSQEDSLAKQIEGSLAKQLQDHLDELHRQVMFPHEPAKLLRPDGTPVPDHWPIFSVGEDIVIRGYVFRVGYIGETTLLLEPVGPAPKSEP